MKKFCIIQLGRIGDLILTTPLFKVIRDSYPESEIHVLAGRNNYKFLNNYPLIDTVHVYKKKFIDTIKLFRRLRKEEFDYWIDPKDHYSRESRIFHKLAKAKFSSGFNREKETVYNHSVRSAKEQFKTHVIDRYLSSISFLDIKETPKRPVLFLNEESENKLTEFLKKKHIQLFIHINISASLSERYWPIEKWRKLIQELSKTNEKIIISSDPKDMDIAINLSKTGTEVYYYKTESLDDLYSLSSRSELLISPDTAVIHIASSFNKKIIGLYANRDWNLNKFAPRADFFKIIINKNSYSKIDEIAVESVLDAFKELKIK